MFARQVVKQLGKPIPQTLSDRKSDSGLVKVGDSIVRVTDCLLVSADGAFVDGGEHMVVACDPLYVDKIAKYREAFDTDKDSDVFDIVYDMPEENSDGSVTILDKRFQRSLVASLRSIAGDGHLRFFYLDSFSYDPPLAQPPVGFYGGELGLWGVIAPLRDQTPQKTPPHALSRFLEAYYD